MHARPPLWCPAGNAAIERLKCDVIAGALPTLVRAGVFACVGRYAVQHCTLVESAQCRWVTSSQWFIQRGEEFPLGERPTFGRDVNDRPSDANDLVGI